MEVFRSLFGTVPKTCVFGTPQEDPLNSYLRTNQRLPETMNAMWFFQKQERTPFKKHIALHQLSDLRCSFEIANKWNVNGTGKH